MPPSPLRFDLLCNADEWDGAWTVNGLAKQLDVNETTIYHFISKKVIPPEWMTHEPNTGIYLFPKETDLVEQLKDRLDINRKRYKIQKSNRLKQQ